MRAIGLRLSTEFRTRRRGWAGLAALLAVFAGLTLATAAGARRTETAYNRLLARTNPYDQFLLGVGPESQAPYPGFADITIPELRSMGGVVEDIYSGYFFNVDGDVQAIGGPDPRLDRTFNAAKVVAGRLPDPSRVDEVAVPVAIADQLHTKPGSSITLKFLDMSGGDNAPPKDVSVTLRVTGIIAEAGEFPPESDLGPPNVHLTPAFYEKNKNWGVFPYSLVRLRHGTADLPAFRAALAGISGGKGVIGYTQAALTRNVNRSFRLQAVALGLFGLCLAIVVGLVLGQILGRQAMAEGVDYPALRALGVTRRQLVALGLVRAAIIAGTGSLLAIPIAILLSPITPTGLARAADPDPGFHVDALALFGGAAVAFIVLMLLAVIPAWRAARLAASDPVFGRAEEGAERTSRAVTVISRAGGSAAAVTGVRMALEPGRGRTAVPVRTTIAGVALAITALTVALSFGASLRYLLHTPRLYGDTYGADVSFNDDETLTQRYAHAIALARRDPDVAITAPIGLGAPFLVDGVQADGMSIAPGDPTFMPPIQAGRIPSADGEIALGPKTLRRIHKNVGDTVQVAVVGVPPTQFTIVARAVVPTVGHTANLGEGAVITFQGLRHFFNNPSGAGLNDEFGVRFKQGVNVRAAQRRLQSLLTADGGQVAPPTTPGDLLNFGRSQNLPFILAGLLALLALATLAHALVTSINRRRRDLAICKTLGFTRGEVARTLAWQSSTFILVALIAGLFVGVVGGRWLWTLSAGQLGILAAPRVPAGTLAIVALAAALLANILALLPGRSAARTRPALVLRSE